MSKNNNDFQIFHILKKSFFFFKFVELRYYLYLALSVFFTVATILINTAIPITLKWVIEVLGNVSEYTRSDIYKYLLLYGLTYLSSRISVQLREIFCYPAVERAVRIFNVHIFKHLHNLSLRFHLGKKTGAIITAIQKVYDGYPDVFVNTFLYLIPTLLEIILAGFVLWYMYGILYGFLLLMIIAIYITVSFLGLRWSSKRHLHANFLQIKTNARLVDSLMNFETVKYFTNTDYEIDQIKGDLKKLERARVRKYVGFEITNLWQGATIGIGLLTAALITGYNVLNGPLKVSDFVLVNEYILQFMTPLSYLGWVMRSFRKGIIELGNVFELYSEEPEVTDIPGAQSVSYELAEVDFEEVTFAYEDTRSILRGMTFKIPAGKTVAIVGPTGSGKSTIVRLLYRFYEPTSGTIFINGKDIRTFTLESLRKMIGIVPQDTVLFNDTLYYNVAYGNPSATQEEIEHAIKMAHLDIFIKRLPDGLQTNVGERGLKLSGGEKQRVAIARVLLKRPIIYVFDEATSALDTATEREIQNNLNEISEGHTTLIIAHRLSTVVHSDKIIVLDHGRIAEQGTHEELLNKNGLYARLWAQQQRENNEE